MSRLRTSTRQQWLAQLKAQMLRRVPRADEHLRRVVSEAAFRGVERRRRAIDRYIARHADELWQAELAARAKEAARLEARRPYRGELECVIERKAIELLGADGFEVTKVGREGWPDQLVVVDDRTLWLEFKKMDGGRLTVAQRRIIPRLREAGATVLVRPTPEEALEAARHMRAR